MMRDKKKLSFSHNKDYEIIKKLHFKNPKKKNKPKKFLKYYGRKNKNTELEYFDENKEHSESFK